MKTSRPLTVLAALLLAMAATAAQPADDVLAGIRTAYSNAQQAIKANTRDKRSCNDMVTTMHYQVPGSGRATEAVQFFYRLDLFGSSSEYADYKLFFVTRQQSLAGRKSYEEYLYDDGGNLIFVFEKGYDRNGKRVERRYYYRDGELHSRLGDTTEGYEHLTFKILAQDYLQSFNNLIRNAKE